MNKAEKRDNQTTYLFVGGVVAIVAIVALVLNSSGGLQGAASYGQMDSSTYNDICVDDDAANDFYTAGTVSLGPYNYEDYCQDDMLTQYYCKSSDNVDATRAFECPNGCWKGKCLAQG